MILHLPDEQESGTNSNAGVLDSYISRIVTGDKEALALLYRATSASVYGFALSILKNTQDAEDVLHDSYIAVYSSACTYRSAGKPMAWVLTITRNLCLQKLRERKKMADVLPENWETGLESRREISEDDKLVISECMNRLSDMERQIIALHAIAGFKHREIADLLHIPLSTVLSKYNRAIKKLKKYLGKESKSDDKSGN